MVSLKTGYIHILDAEGKLFLKCVHELVLTVWDDYVRYVCLDLAARSSVFLKAVLMRILSCSEIYEKGKK